MVDFGVLIQAAALYVGLTVLHELGHMAGAVLGGLRVKEVGHALLPVPHAYVHVEAFPDAACKYLFFLSGPLVTVLATLGMWGGGLLTVQSIYLAVAARLLLDANPFFSDFTQMTTAYRYTLGWYLHLLGWGGATVLTVQHFVRTFQPALL